MSCTSCIKEMGAVIGELVYVILLFVFGVSALFFLATPTISVFYDWDPAAMANILNLDPEKANWADEAKIFYPIGFILSFITWIIWSFSAEDDPAYHY